MFYFPSILGIFVVAVAVILVASNERIVNGVARSDSKAPYEVTILHNTDDKKCSGAILNNRIILTAAHCVLDKSPQDIWVVNNLFSPRRYQRIPVMAFRAHKDFHLEDEEPRPNDVALIFLRGLFQFNPKIQSIALAESTPKKGELAFASGHGFRFQPKNNTKNFQGEEYPIVNVPDDFIEINCSIKGFWLRYTGGPLAVNGQLVGLGLTSCSSSRASFLNVVKLSKWIKDTRMELERLK